jgi:hypothetical protein
MDGTQNGIFTFTQTIILNDNVGPIFTPLNDVTVTADMITCTRFVSLITSATDCGMATVITNDFNGGGGNASGQYPIGVTLVIFTSTDACGNVSTMDVQVTVLDGDPPTIMCEKIVRYMTEELEIEVNAEEFITFTPGSCTDASDYLFSYSPVNEFDSLRIFGCQFAGSVEPVMIYTFDLGGNPIDTCRGDLDFRDSLDLCGQGLTLTGMLFGENFAMINGVPVLISEQTMTTAYTDDKGRYTYRDLQEGATYIIAPYNDDHPREGVSTLDLVAIQKHLLGYKPLTSPYKLIAADANKSGTVTVLDLIEIRRLLLNQIQSFPHNTSWRFVDAQFDFPDPENPWVIGFPEQMRFDSVQEHMTHKDFIGIKIGDVNNTVFQLKPDVIDVRSDEALILSTEDRVYKAGERFEVPIHVTGYTDVLGYQFVLQFNPAHAGFTGVSIPDNSRLSTDWFGLSGVDEGQIASLWYESEGRDEMNGEVLFAISLVAKHDVRLSELFYLTERGLEPEAYTDGGEKTIPVQLRIDGVVPTPEFQVFQNVPNPFSRGTIIPLQLPEATTVSLEVFAFDGRLVYSSSREADAGYTEFALDAEDLPQGGIYYYTISTDHFRGTRKMILME